MNPGSITVASLIAVNLLPLVGVLVLDWDLFTIMMVYWLENGIVGLYSLVKIAFASKGGPNLEKIFLMPFFTVHYGLFWVVHGVFVSSLFGPGGFPRAGFSPFSLLAPESLVSLSRAYGWALLGLVLSHGVSLGLNYFAGGEYRRAVPREQMAQPYQRVVVLHVAILAGGFVTTLLGAPILALVVLVGMKIALDVQAHLREHRGTRLGGVWRR